MARIRILVTQFKVQDHVETKFHDKQVLRQKARSLSLKIVCHMKPVSLVVR